MRAVVSQPTPPSPTSSTTRLPRAKRLVRMMTMNRYGSAYSTSTKRIIQPSRRPPAKPATAPQADADEQAQRARHQAERAATDAPRARVRTYRSRPSRSVPNQCAPAAPGGLREVIPVQRLRRATDSRPARGRPAASGRANTHSAARAPRRRPQPHGGGAPRDPAGATDSTMPHGRIEPAIEQVTEEVQHQGERAVHHDHAEHQRVVAIDRPLHQVAPGAGQSEHALHHQ